MFFRIDSVPVAQGRASLVLLFAPSAFARLGPESSPQTSGHVDSILVLKREHLMELLAGGRVIRTYKAALGRGGLAPKEREGDARTLEGHNVIDSRNEHSGFYRALHISYPNAGDSSRAAKLGVTPGGAIMIHGIKNGLGWLGATHCTVDWTAGCIVVTDDEIDEVWNLVPVGTPVEIRP
ncbi:MAG: L,D-transpeptidase family protein [Terracidiphilus sp.]